MENSDENKMKKIKDKIKGFFNTKLAIYIISILLFVAFLSINLFLDKFDLPKIDVTENKVFSLSEESIDYIKKVNQTVKIYVLGYGEDSSVVDLIKQYVKYNDMIKYEIITIDGNRDLALKYNLQTGDQDVIIECGEKNKILGSYDFASYDYTTYQQIDLTENAITNAILNLTIAEKPKVYFLNGHNELPLEQYYTQMLAYLQNEVFEYKNINLLTVDKIPDDCKLIAAMSPRSDLLDQEVELLNNYINNGGNIIITNDLLDPEKADLPNWQKILDLYGLKFENGLVYELDDNYCVVSTDGQRVPTIYYPHLGDSSITSEIKSDSGMLLETTTRIQKTDEETQKNLNVTYEDLLTTSNKSVFLNDLTQNGVAAVYSQEQSESLIAVKATKQLNKETQEGENAETEEKKTELIAISSGVFVSNVQSSVNSQLSQVNVGDNANFFINSIANLTNREDSVKVRKETNSSTYFPTENQNLIVVIVITVVPIVVIITGIVVWHIRKRKK